MKCTRSSSSIYSSLLNRPFNKAKEFPITALAPDNFFLLNVIWVAERLPVSMNGTIMCVFNAKAESPVMWRVSVGTTGEGHFPFNNATLLIWRLPSWTEPGNHAWIYESFLSALQTAIKITLYFIVLSRKSPCAFSGALILLWHTSVAPITPVKPDILWNSFYINFCLRWPYDIFPATYVQYFYNSPNTVKCDGNSLKQFWHFSVW